MIWKFAGIVPATITDSPTLDAVLIILGILALLAIISGAAWWPRR